MDCYLCNVADWELRTCDACKRLVCGACASVWLLWHIGPDYQRVRMLETLCRPCVRAMVLRAAAEGRSFAGDVEMAASFEELDCWD
jgi:hypothetical protein